MGRCGAAMRHGRPSIAVATRGQVDSMALQSRMQTSSDRSATPRTPSGHQRQERVGRYVGSVALICAGIAALAAARSAPASDPPPVGVFRGDADHSGSYGGAGSGIYGGILWRKQTGGPVRSSPTIAGGVAFIGSADGRFYALDANTGREKWSFAAGSAISSSAAVAAGRAFFASRDGTFYALNTSDGALLWKRSLGADLPRAYEHESGEHPPTHDFDFYVSSAAIAGDMVVVGGGDGGVHAYGVTSGEPRWTFRTGGRIRSSPAINGGVVYVGSYDGSVYALNVRTGALVWRYDTAGRSLNSAEFGFDRKSILSSPAVADGTVYIGSRDAHLYAIDAAKGTLRWSYNYENDDMTWAISSPAVRGGVVYMGAAGGEFVHALSAADGHELWRLKTPGRVWASPAVAGSEFYCADESGRFFALDAVSGKERWHFQTWASAQSSAAVANGTVFFGSNDGGVYAVRVDGGHPMQRAVYWDAETAKLFGRSDLGTDYVGFQLARDFLEARGYEVLLSSTVEAWLAKRVADRDASVIVFPTDTLPASLGGPDPAHGPLRRYLESGGKVVWSGFPPLLLKPVTENDALSDILIRRNDTSSLLGISFDGALNGDMTENRVTPTGREWGLPEWWLGGWDLPISGNVTVLALNERGYAGAWVKNYGGPPGTGFVYIGTKNWDGDILNRIAAVAEYRPRVP